MTLVEKNNIIHGLVGTEVTLFEHHYSGGGPDNTYLCMVSAAKDNSYPDENATMDELLKMAWIQKARIKWTHIETVCLQIVGTEVWVDQEIAITVASVGGDEDGTHVTSTTGRTYSTNNLWLRG